MSAPSKHFVSTIIENIGEQLRIEGFNKRKAGIYNVELAPDVLGWVGLNEATGRGDGKLWINPMLGVRHQRVEAEWSRLAGEKPHKYSPPTLVANVGDLGPKAAYKEWAFAEGKDNGDALTSVARAILTSGLNFMRNTTSLEAMRRHAKDMMVPEYLLFRLPLMFGLDGDDKRAIATIERDLARTKKRKDEAIEEYRGFAKRYLQELQG